MTLTIQSGCKVNLLLNILGRREDGFHELETLMQPIPLFDELTFERSGTGINLSTDHPTLPCDDSNLIVRAADAFLKTTGITDGVRIHLSKRLPMEAGMAGGSANAAATLVALHQIFGSPLAPDQLHTIAARLGSDVPFFLQPNPALATGRGERIQALEPLDALRGLTFLILHPGFGISTAWSYKTLGRFPTALRGQPGRGEQLVRALQSNSEDWGDLFYNSLEKPAFWKYPVLELHVRHLRKSGARAALMSGSGSTTFGVFASRELAEDALSTFCSKFGTPGWSAVVQV